MRQRGAPTLTRAVTGGAVWMGGSLGLQVAIGLVAQVVLAGILSAHDFGLFALSVSVSQVLSTAANFGIATLMAQRTPDAIAGLRTPVLRAGMAASALLAALLALIAPLASRLLGEPELTGLLLVTGSTFVLKPFVAVTTAALQARLRFSRVAWSLLIAATAHYASAIVLARAGAGAMSLVVGLQVNVVVSVVTLWAFGRRLGIGSTRSTVTAREAAAMARWPMAGEIALEGSGRIDFLMLGLFVPTEAVGLYYFAFMLIVRLNVLFAGVTRNVLYPALAQIAEHRERQAAGVLRAGTLLALGGGAAAAALIAAMFPIEEILWGGRWEAAVPAMMVLASVSPGQAVQAAVEQLLKARARFRLWTAVIAVRTLGGGLVALVTGAVLGEGATAAAIAAPIAVFLVVEGIVEVAVIGGPLGVPVIRYWASALPVWFALVGGGWVVVGVVSRLSMAAWPAVVLSLGLVGVVTALAGLVVWRLRLAARV